MSHNYLSSSSWFHCWHHKPQAYLRLFCFPYAGGGASIFRSLSEQAPEEIEIYPILLPGRESRLDDPPFSSLDSLITTLHDVLLPSLEKPYAFFGHSMGALICFELARALRRKGQLPGPRHLFVSAHRAPHLPNHRPPIHHLPEPLLLDALRHLNGTPEVILNNAELLQFLLPLLRADFTLCETYTYTSEPPLSCPISAFGGLQDPDVPRESILAWRDQTSSNFQSNFFPGDHFFLHKEQNELLKIVAQNLFQDLQEL